MTNYEQQEKEIFERLWKRMDGRYSLDPWHYTSQTVNPGVADFLTYCVHKNITGQMLDVGCGNGKHVLAFTQKGFVGFGIDIAPSAIKFAKTITKEKQLKTHFHTGSVLDLPYQKNKFDVVIDCGCFHHLRKSEWSAYLANINKVLKPGGYYFLQVFSRDCGATTKLGKRSKDGSYAVRNGHYFHFYHNEEVRQIFIKNFAIIKSYDLPRATSPIIFKIFYLKKK